MGGETSSGIYAAALPGDADPATIAFTLPPEDDLGQPHLQEFQDERSAPIRSTHSPLTQGYCFFPPRPTLQLMRSDMSSSQKSQIDRLTSTTTLTFQRSRDRLETSCPIMFAGAPAIGEGVIHNLSESGCLIECERKVLEGSYVTVRLLLPDHFRTLVIELAAIRWVREHYFGMEFLRLPAPDRSRLCQFLSAHHR